MKDLLQMLLLAVGLLGTLAGGGVSFIARKRSDCWGRRWRYVLLGGGFGFVAGISFGAITFVDHPDVRVLPMPLAFGLVVGVLDAVIVFNTLWASEWRRRHSTRPADGGMEERDDHG